MNRAGSWVYHTCILVYTDYSYHYKYTNYKITKLNLQYIHVAVRATAPLRMQRMSARTPTDLVRVCGRPSRGCAPAGPSAS